jgi:thiaminase
MVTFADELKLSSIKIWQKILNHKFIMEIYNGILLIDKFVFYIKQDQIFLEEIFEGSKTKVR